MLHALYPYFNSYTGFQLILKPQHDFHLCISHRFCLLTLQRVETTDLEVWAQGYPGDRCCRFRRCRRRKTSRTWCLDKGMSSVPTNLQHLHWLYKSNTHSATHSRDITWRRISDRLTDGWMGGWEKPEIAEHEGGRNITVRQTGRKLFIKGKKKKQVQCLTLLWPWHFLAQVSKSDQFICWLWEILQTLNQSIWRHQAVKSRWWLIMCLSERPTNQSVNKQAKIVNQWIWMVDDKRLFFPSL